MELWQVVLWGVLAVLLIIVEVVTPQFVAVWFAAGSILSFVSTFFGTSFIVQLLIFTLASLIFLILTRPLVKKLTLEKVVPTNADAIIGQKGMVIEKIDIIANTGRISVDGNTWSAKLENENDIINENDVCEVVGIEGVKAVIKKINIKGDKK